MKFDLNGVVVGRQVQAVREHTPRSMPAHPQTLVPILD